MTENIVTKDRLSVIGSLGNTTGKWIMESTCA